MQLLVIARVELNCSPKLSSSSQKQPLTTSIWNNTSRNVKRWHGVQHKRNISTTKKISLVAFVSLWFLQYCVLSALRSLVCSCRERMVEKLKKMIAIDGNANPTVLNTRRSVVAHNGSGKSKMHAEIFHWGKCFTVRNVKIGMLTRIPKNQVSKQIPLAMVLFRILLCVKV